MQDFIFTVILIVVICGVGALWIGFWWLVISAFCGTLKMGFDAAILLDHASKKVIAEKEAAKAAVPPSDAEAK